MAEYHFRRGKKREEVAKELNISLEKLCKLMGGKKKVDDAENSKVLIDYEVENALIKKACGYKYTEVKETEKSSGTEITTTYKEIAPDITAVKLWLETNAPDFWGDKTEKASSEEKLDKILDELDKYMDDENAVQQ